MHDIPDSLATPNTQETSTRAHACLLFDQAELEYDFGEEHPMQSRRLVALMDLLETSGLWSSTNEETRLQGQVATVDQLHLVHSKEYVAAVQQLSQADEQNMSEFERRSFDKLAMHYGFGDGDTPVIPGMHDVAARICGNTLAAMSAVLGLPEGGTFANEKERPLHVFHPAGGWHHAWYERASGFCIYNDISVAIAHVLQASEAKVLYIDFDAHHGDGTQRSFYDDPHVMTVSFHETGRYLFPGTGDVLELGSGSGRGYSVNIPLEPFTEDDSYIDCMNALLEPLITSFAPDVIISMHGCDTHTWDPLTHLRLTMRGFVAQVKAAHELAHAYCGGRWVALGGGGYDPYRVVPRAWSLLWAEISEQSAPQDLPEAWVARWSPAWEARKAQEELAEEAMGKVPERVYFPTLFLDRSEDFPPVARRLTISDTNRRTVAQVRQLVLPTPIRHAFPTARHKSPLTDMFDLLHLNREDIPSRSKVLQTQAGPILLRDFCPPSLIERLRAENGLHAFARIAEREHQLLLNIAKSLDCELTIAHIPNGEIIGQVTLAPAEDWWEGLENVYEIAIEVSANWRGIGLAKELLAFALELDALEDIILVALGLSWHWDYESMNIPLYKYRQLIARLFGSQGFREYETAEPDISEEPGNILLARIGKNVAPHIANRFRNRLNKAPNLL